MTNKSKELNNKLNHLRELFKQQLPERISHIIETNKALKVEQTNATVLNELHKISHSLAGAGGTFGYHQLSEQSRVLEEYVNNLLFEKKIPGVNDLEIISEMVAELTELANHEPEPNHIESNRLVSVKSDYKMADEDNLIYVIEDDKELALDLAAKLMQFGYKVECYHSATEAVAALKIRIPFAMIIDVILPEGPLAGPGFVTDLEVLRDCLVPLFFMSIRNDWEARLACVRAGSMEYFTKPIDINLLIDKLDLLSDLGHEDPYRVLIVEDVDVLAQHYALVLKGAGHDVTVVTDVRHLLENLTRQKAELILMDLYMPECTGIEAAKMIRQIDDYVDVPIVFLSTESEVGEQLKALKIGGDEFLHKPIRDDHLIAAVSIRARRFRHLRSLMVRDSLTGLINHIALSHELEREISRSTREKGELSFVMLDIDYFKGVNDQYGHQAGDKVLKSLARILIQRLRKSDIIARYGGEEFGLILPGTRAAEAFNIIDQIRQDFSLVNQYSDKGSFNVTFSAGISSCPKYTTVDDIVGAADNSLYQAKRRGRNCVVVDKVLARKN